MASASPPRRRVRLRLRRGHERRHRRPERGAPPADGSRLKLAMTVLMLLDCSACVTRLSACWNCGRVVVDASSASVCRPSGAAARARSWPPRWPAPTPRPDAARSPSTGRLSAVPAAAAPHQPHLVSTLCMAACMVGAPNYRRRRQPARRQPRPRRRPLHPWESTRGRTGSQGSRGAPRPRRVVGGRLPNELLQLLTWAASFSSLAPASSRRTAGRCSCTEEGTLDPLRRPCRPGRRFAPR